MSAIIEPENQLRYQRLTGVLGAEITGVDITAPLDERVLNALRDLLVEHKVIFFRKQPLTTKRLLDFALNFGTPEPYALGKLANLTFHPEYPDVAVLDSIPGQPPARADVWHSDLTFQEKPSFGSVLHCVIAPPVGGDTLWADMEAAYEGLDDKTRSRLSGMVAIHDWRRQIPNARRKGIPEEAIQELEATFPQMEHPLVRTHPVSGRKCIYVNTAFTIGIKDMKESESGPLLQRLFDLARIPEYQCRFRWQADSVAFWDNRSTQHYAVLDYVGQRRRMERVTFAGDRPF